MGFFQNPRQDRSKQKHNSYLPQYDDRGRPGYAIGGDCAGDGGPNIIQGFDAVFFCTIHDYWHNFTLLSIQDGWIFRPRAPLYTLVGKQANKAIAALSPLWEWQNRISHKNADGIDVKYERLSNKVHQWALGNAPSQERQEILQHARNFVRNLAKAQSILRTQGLPDDDVQKFAGYWCQAVFWGLCIVFNPSTELRALAPEFAALDLPDCPRSQGNTAERNYNWVREHTARATNHYFETLWDEKMATIPYRETPKHVGSITADLMEIYFTRIRPALQEMAETIDGIPDNAVLRACHGRFVCAR